MSQKTRIFISSVQKELELERAAVAGLIATDPFLLHHCIAKKLGKGRSVRYVLAYDPNRQVIVR